MGLDATFEWTATIGEVVLGATKADGGTRSVSYRIGGGTTLPFLETGPPEASPLIAFEICDNPRLWSPVVRDYCGDIINDPAAWAKAAESDYRADMVRLNLTSTKERNFSDVAVLGKTVESVLSATSLPLIIEGSNEPKIDSEIFPVSYTHLTLPTNREV